MKRSQEALERVRAEYLEMPGMRLTPRQIQRLCGIDEMVCRRLLDTMVDEGFLCVKADGSYARLTEGTPRRPLPLKADLRASRARPVAAPAR